jgi:hypothetical protein
MKKIFCKKGLYYWAKTHKQIFIFLKKFLHHRKEDEISYNNCSKNEYFQKYKALN